MAKKERRICCVEAFWEDEGQVVEPSIKPMLELFSQWGYWAHDHIKCKTVDLAKAFLGEKWKRSAGSVLFFATHGSPGCITLSNEEKESICLRKLARASCLADQCEGSLVHFSACKVFKDEAAVDDFLRVTGASAVSGYRTDVGWAETDKPALPLDLMLLNQLWETNIDFSSSSKSKRKLGRIECDLRKRFSDCQFRIVQNPN